VPEDVSDEKDGRDAVDDAPDVEHAAVREDRSKEAHLVEHQGKAGQDEEGEREDEDPMLDPLRQVHPEEDLVVADEAAPGHFVHRLLRRR
jgi:hypothetical protein